MKRVLAKAPRNAKLAKFVISIIKAHNRLKSVHGDKAMPQTMTLDDKLAMSNRALADKK